MAILAKDPGGGDFVRILAPDGLQVAVCCDVLDRGIHKSQWEGRQRSAHKVSLHWLLLEKIPVGLWIHPHTGAEVKVPDEIADRPFGVQKWYTLSLHEKSVLRHDLRVWRGRDFTGPELDGFDLENLIGVGCYVNIMHAERNGEWYANVEGLVKLPKGVPSPTIPADYVRLKDRPPRDAAPDDYDEDDRTDRGEEPQDDPLPF